MEEYLSPPKTGAVLNPDSAAFEQRNGVIQPNVRTVTVHSVRERGRDTPRTLPDTMEVMHPADGVTSTAKFARECLVSDLLAFQASVPSGLMAQGSAALRSSAGS